MLLIAMDAVRYRRPLISPWKNLRIKIISIPLETGESRDYANINIFPIASKIAVYEVKQDNWKKSPSLLGISTVFRAISIHSHPFAAIPNHSHPFAAIRSHSQLFPSIRSHSQPFAAIPIHSQPFSAIRSYSQPFAYIPRHSEWPRMRFFPLRWGS